MSRLKVYHNGDWVFADRTSEIDLPTVTSSDNGCVLTVVDGEWDTGAIPAQLPVVTATNNGDVLTVVNGAWDKATPSSGNTPDIIISGVSTGGNEPANTDLSSATFTFNGTITDLLTKLQTYGYLDVAGQLHYTNANGNTEYLPIINKSLQNTQSGANQIVPHTIVETVAPGLTDYDAILLSVITTCAKTNVDYTFYIYADANDNDTVKKLVM